ncbi:11453_t:CDS:1 [Paraglomus brasilianum]|uniref:11453_t:CDS:1 n=1 Tax=Paraglomus brasilianum TaxID=144538 RepID=A0A9N9DS94_9GLOM|nr:11453_t:CDS:1 [Paraglomus brasilianum]
MYSIFGARFPVLTLFLAVIALATAVQLPISNPINATLTFKPASSRSNLHGSFNLFDDGLRSGTMVTGSFHSGLDEKHKYLFIAYTHSTCNKLTSNRFFKFDVTNTFSFDKLNKIGGTNYLQKTDLTWFWGKNMKTAIVAYRNISKIRSGDEEGDIDEDIYMRWRKFGCGNVKIITG